VTHQLLLENVPLFHLIDDGTILNHEIFPFVLKLFLCIMILKSQVLIGVVKLQLYIN